MASQIKVALGGSLSEIGLDLDNAINPKGFAIQARVNLETIKDTIKLIIIPIVPIPSGDIPKK